MASFDPRFLNHVLPRLIKYAGYELKKRKKTKVYQRSFYYLRQQGLVNFEYKGKQLYISLTKEGKKKARKYDIDNLKIKKPKRWDKKWRILIFDVKDKQKVKREALRGKLKELGFYQLQKSVWVCPYDFQKEVEILREFFYFNFNEMRVVTTAEIEQDVEVRKFFNIR